MVMPVISVQHFSQGEFLLYNIKNPGTRATVSLFVLNLDRHVFI